MIFRFTSSLYQQYQRTRQEHFQGLSCGFLRMGRVMGVSPSVESCAAAGGRMSGIYRGNF